MFKKHAAVTAIAVVACTSTLIAQDKNLQHNQSSIGQKGVQFDVGFYRIIDGVWYQIDNERRYRVDNNVITVRFHDDNMNVAQAALIESNNQISDIWQNVNMVRTNRLLQIDLDVEPLQQDVMAIAQLLESSELVQWVSLNTFGVYFGGTPSDPEFSDQWSIHNTGQSGGSSGADMHALEAWDIQRGDSTVVVGVLDSGTDVFHVDLAPNTWINAGEIPGNGVDDDGNGFIDDVYGWDFGNNNNDVTSSSSHGTLVAGCITARSNNNIGIAALAGGWGGTSGCRSMPAAVGQDFPIGSVLDDAMIYATDNGVRVITLSLGVGETTAINNAIDYAVNDNGVFMDCASGNGGSSVGYPAYNSNVVAVAASNRNDNIAGFSNPGPQVEVAAPGVDVLSTVPGNGYSESSGTSFAAPHVGALAALMFSQAPCMTNEEVRQALKDSADDIDAPGFDNNAGHGRINAYEALLIAESCVECLADVDGDLMVGTTDLLALLSVWGSCPFGCAPDFNNDGDVNTSDLLFLLSVWGDCTE